MSQRADFAEVTCYQKDAEMAESIPSDQKEQPQKSKVKPSELPTGSAEGWVKAEEARKAEQWNRIAAAVQARYLSIIEASILQPSGRPEEKEIQELRGVKQMKNPNGEAGQEDQQSTLAEQSFDAEQSDKNEQLARENPTLNVSNICKMYLHNRFGGPVEAEAESVRITEGKELSAEKRAEQLQLMKNRLASLKAARKELQERRQAKNNARKEELETLKEEHEKTVAKDKTAEDVDEAKKAEQSQEAEQRKLDREAYRDALHGRRIRGGEKRVPFSRYSDEITELRKKHPTLSSQEAHEMWYHNTFTVPIEGFVKKDDVLKLNEKQAESKEAGLSTLQSELTSLKAAKEELEERKQMEINVLKQELETLKEEHEKTVAKDKIAEDVAQRDDTLEQKLVSLAEAMLVVKRGNEKSFKDLKRRVKKIGEASELEHLKDELLKTKEELEAKNVLIEELQKAEPSEMMKMLDEPETKYVKADELQRSLDGEEEVKFLEKAARENLTKLLFKEMFGEDFEFEGTVLKEQAKIQKVLPGGASQSDHLKEELLKIKEELEAKNVLIEELQKSLSKKELELAQNSNEAELSMSNFKVAQLTKTNESLAQHLKTVESAVATLKEQGKSFEKVKAEFEKKMKDNYPVFFYTVLVMIFCTLYCFCRLITCIFA